MLLLAAAALFVSVPSLFSQQVTINEKGLQKKIERSDEDIANPKKSGNAATWLNRGQAFYDAATEVSKNLYDGIPAETVLMMFGEPTGGEIVQIDGKQYNKGIFPYVDVYLNEANQPVSWIVTREIVPDALAKSVEAYNKAYELDGGNRKTAEKVNEGLRRAYDEYSKTGALYFALSMYDAAAGQFVKAYEVSQLPGVSIPESNIYTLLHDAGLAYMLAKDYPHSIEYLVNAEKLAKDDPEIYYLLYHAYRGNAEADPQGLSTAKDYLEKGMAKYPTDPKIIESLSEAYVLLGEDPDKIMSVVREAVENDPKNADMWSALGVLYVSQENYDGAIDAFGHMVKLMPESYIANNNMGIVYIKKAEEILDQANQNLGTQASEAEYAAEQARGLEEYAKAVPYLERASQIDPTNLGTVELLKNVTFRIREMDGMMAKYEKYNALYKSMTGAQ